VKIVNERQLRFIKVLAKFLVENEVEMSLKLELSAKNPIFAHPEAKIWSELRGATPLFGYYDGEDGLAKAEAELIRFLNPQG
jgi:hypothetical protein